MRKVGLMVGVALVAIACSSQEGETKAGAEALCRDWCTCSGTENPSCLVHCTYGLLADDLCGRNEDRRYYTCMIDRECSDPLDDCDHGTHPSYWECVQTMTEQCYAECPGDEPCEGTGWSCLTLCLHGATCDRVLTCEESGCGTDRVCWTTGECDQVQQGLQINPQCPYGSSSTMYLYACFEITGASYPATEVICTFGYFPPPINLSLKTGTYGILLQDGFRFARGANQPTTWLPIPFPPGAYELTSPNPQMVQVVTGQVTVVSLQFQSSNGSVTLNLGETPCRTEFR